MDRFNNNHHHEDEEGDGNAVPENFPDTSRIFQKHHACTAGNEISTRLLSLH